MARITFLNPGEMWGGKGGNFPDFTMVMSSAWVWAVEKGELAVSTARRAVASTYARAHISKTKHPRLHMSDLVSYRFSDRISGGMYSGVWRVEYEVQQ
jgi:hypothetical protein